ncbi:MAG: fasciclin domain-containing protein [Gemmatimonadaceae bacterium]|nr:fasciclin domain-containing protein [Gloeobacterales cyanobacterium ES-bin-141]
MDIVDTAVQAGQFQTLATALQAAGLVDALKGEGPFTVFAPTDEAFTRLPQGVLDDLLKPENKAALSGVLTYHVVSGKVLSTDLKEGNVITLDGGAVIVDFEGQGVKINDANVVQADITADNGVIHVIDKVLLPAEAP